MARMKTRFLTGLTGLIGFAESRNREFRSADASSASLFGRRAYNPRTTHPRSFSAFCGASISLGQTRILLGAILVAMLAASASAADSFNWNTNQNRVTADVQSGNLSTVLGRI